MRIKVDITKRFTFTLTEDELVALQQVLAGCRELYVISQQEVVRAIKSISYQDGRVEHPNKVLHEDGSYTI